MPSNREKLTTRLILKFLATVRSLSQKEGRQLRALIAYSLLKST